MHGMAGGAVLVAMMGDDDDDGDDTQKLIITKLIRKAYKPTAGFSSIMQARSGDGDGRSGVWRYLAKEHELREHEATRRGLLRPGQPKVSNGYLGCCLINCDL